MLLPAIRAKLQEAVDGPDWSKKSLSEVAGCSESYIANVLNGHTKSPGAEPIIRALKAIGVSIDELAGIRPTVELQTELDQETDALLEAVVNSARRKLQSTGVGTDDVVSWWRRENGVLRNYDRIKTRIGLFDHPSKNDQVIKARYLGPESLAAVVLGAHSTEELAKRIEENIDEQTNKLLVNSYSSIKQGEPQLSFETHTIISPHNGEFATVSYNRVLLPVTDEQSGARLVLNFCVALP